MKPHHRFADFLQLVILLILLTTLLVITPFGLKLVAKITNISGTGLHIEGIRGTLLDGINVSTLSWEKNKIRVELKDIHLKFSSTIYKKNKLTIKDLNASSLNIYIPPANKANKKHIVIPNIPIPVNVTADHVKLDTLRIIQDKKDLLFKIQKMEINDLSIIDQHLTAQTATAQPLIWDESMLIDAKQVNVDLRQPHAMSGVASIHYSHIQIGDFISDNVTVGGTLTDYQIEADIDWNEKLLGILGDTQLSIKATGNYHHAFISDAQLKHTDGSLQSHGEISWIDKFAWDFNVLGNNINLDKFTPSLSALVNIDLDTKGEFTYANKQWLLDTNLNTLKGRVDGYPVTASGGIILKDHILIAKHFLVKTDKNKIFVEGRITEPFHLKWDINAKNIGQLIPGYKGSIVGKGTTRGTTFEPTGSGKLKIKGFKGSGVSIKYADINLQGGARESLFSGKGTAIIRNAQYGDFKLASADVQFNGFNGNEKTTLLAGKGKATIKNLTYQDYFVAAADIEFNGNGQESLFAGKGKVKLTNVKYKDYRIASVKLNFDGKNSQSLLMGKGNLLINNLTSRTLKIGSSRIDFDGSQKSLNLKGNVSQLTMAGQTINQAKVRATGTIKHHRVKLSGKSKQGDFTVTASGGWIDPRWKGNIAKIVIRNTSTGNWILKKPVNISVTQQTFSSSEICVTNPHRGQLCTDTSWDIKQGITSKGKLIRVPLSQLKPWLPGNIDVTGVINGTYTINKRKDGLYGSAEFHLPNHYIQLTSQSGKREKLSYRGGSIKLNFKSNKVEVISKIQVEKRGLLITHSIITLDPKKGNHRIQGEATLDIAKLAWAQEFFPDIARLQGKITSKITYEGPFNKLSYSGEMRLDNGRLAIPDTGTQLSNIHLLIKTTRPNKAKIQGSLTTGGGKLTLDGTLQIRKLNDWLAELNLKGNNLRFMNTHEIQAYASPDLHLKISPGLAIINGVFHIPKARIRLSELPETAIYESDDVIFVGDKKQARDSQKKPLRILPNVTISLGKDISFEGFGLKSKLSGKFHVSHNRMNIISRGTLKINDGEYQAYGQHLTIEHGVLVFNGPFSNPGLDIRATRIIRESSTIDDIKVGINLAGTLQKPKSSIFSDPPKSESDALSYLITGQSLSNTSGDQAQLLVQAVRSLGINSGSTLLNKISGSLGLDDLNIITYSDYRKNKLQLGKRLGPNLYIRYITGLFDTFHKIAVDYKLSDKWTLQAESGEAQGIDFIYSIDSN